MPVRLSRINLLIVAIPSYLDDIILRYIVKETNQYASQISSAIIQADWFKTNIYEILVLFSFLMMLGMICMLSIKSWFSVLKTEILRRMFTFRSYNSLSPAYTS